MVAGGTEYQATSRLTHTFLQDAIDDDKFLIGELEEDQAQHRHRILGCAERSIGAQLIGSVPEAIGDITKISSHGMSPSSTIILIEQGDRIRATARVAFSP